jgi:uncharacterized Fe-S center protein
MTNVQIAQKVAHMIVAANVANVTSTQIANHTDLDEDSIAASVAGVVVGEMVARRTDKYTDPLVVKTAEFIKTHRPKISLRRSKKS